uniref:Zinc finger protein 507-like n=1 Tax=Saccoglossus kowalevskii TaxID=10224 RepID=A0ABM0MA90_SACKO|nr:PREDICTED: zinc finger protein 507-like [Saccoglossus kowalevskii]
MKNLMTRHQRTHEISRKYKCNQCDFVTVELSVLQDHLKIHNQNQELMLKCSECGYSCKCEELLREHMWKHIDKIAPHGIVQVQMEGAQNEEPAKPADGDQVSSDPSPLSNSPVSSQTVASKPQPTCTITFQVSVVRVRV